MALASGAAMVTIPKNAVILSAASTGTDKRIVASFLGVQQIKPHSKTLSGRPMQRLCPGSLFRIYRELLPETFLCSFPISKPECFVAGRTSTKFAKSNRVPVLKTRGDAANCCRFVHHFGVARRNRRCASDLPGQAVPHDLLGSILGQLRGTMRASNPHTPVSAWYLPAQQGPKNEECGGQFMQRPSQ
jgi:hypothetical protein